MKKLIAILIFIMIFLSCKKDHYCETCLAVVTQYGTVINDLDTYNTGIEICDNPGLLKTYKKYVKHLGSITITYDCN